MSMGTREPDQSPLWIAASDLPASPGHPFYARLNTVLDTHGFDRFAEDQCREFYARTMGRPSLAPGQYFRLLMVGYFEGIDSERGIAWRAADSLAVRSFVRLALNEAAPDHSTISRTRPSMPSTWKPAPLSRSRCRALIKATPRRSPTRRPRRPTRSKTRKRMSTRHRNWKKSSPTRGITATTPWSISPPSASAPMWPNRLAVV